MPDARKIRKLKAIKLARKLTAPFDFTISEAKWKKAEKDFSDAELMEIWGRFPRRLGKPLTPQVDDFSEQMLQRLSQLTRIRQEELMPIHYQGEVPGDADAVYNIDTHSINYRGNVKPQIIRHETLHGIQHLLTGVKRNYGRTKRFGEPAANTPVVRAFIEGGVNYPTLASFPLGTAALIPLVTGGTIQALRHKNFRSLIDGNRVDEALAFMMLPYPEPLALNAQLKELEEHGFLENGRLTEKGEKWIARRREPMLSFLKAAEKNRTKFLEAEKGKIK